MDNEIWSLAPLRMSARSWRIAVWLCVVQLTTLSHSLGQLFPGLEGEELVDEIRNTFTPSVVLNDTQAKDTLYARIFRVQDSVRCIYSGLPRFLPDGVDPSQWLFGSGLEVTSINLEHSWPQAKGAGDGTNGNTDMHHLFPSRTDINSDRANHPFGDIQDQLTAKWYYQDQEMSTIPATNLNAYSEFLAPRFEPREAVKGDMARAMMYFWTIYRDDAIAADPAFFDIQRNDLCAWHVADPVDSWEMDRTLGIANYQDGKANPFVLDCTLALRAYCPDQPDCGTVATEPFTESKITMEFDAVKCIFRIISSASDLWDVRISSVSGHVIFLTKVSSGQWKDMGLMPAGIYFISATNGRLSGSWPVITMGH